MKLKNKLEEYTEAEFLEILNKIWATDVSTEEEHDKLIEHFSKVTEHPQGNGLIFYPAADVEDSPEGVLKVVKEWRAANGKTGFKQP
ncbi:bacteriocin immunity protein [Pseudomonas mediterranea]|uniref:bacteriocin immunity protein n=1 Tax=Pseudomonas mediterranea TaxID=183795 RepID=UPI002234D9ED|nr:bacteriocin immunity protein [Pseudomonas mediterranea]UZE00846.1 bacteriocin immunity protein [Pseudomonas mediterranea]